jgi:hypothetical protein
MAAALIRGKTVEVAVLEKPEVFGEVLEEVLRGFVKSKTNILANKNPCHTANSPSIFLKTRSTPPVTSQTFPKKFMIDCRAQIQVFFRLSISSIFKDDLT